MAIEVERLIATLEARIDKYEKSLAKARGTTNREFKKIEERGKLMEARLGKLGVTAFAGLARGALATLAPILSVAAALRGARNALDQFSAISDNAKASGLDPETFQELAYQAEQSGVEFDAFSGSLATFAKNSGLAVVGKGRMVTALKALNPELLANIQAATTQEERIRLAADAIDDAATSSEKAALATAMFGESGTKLVDAFNGGSAAIDTMAAKARALGIVVDRDLIAKSEQLGDELSTATQVMNLEFSKALVNLAPILISIAQLAGNVAAAIGGIIDMMRSLEDQSTSKLRTDLAGLNDTISQATVDRPDSVVTAMDIDVGGDADIAALVAQRDKIAAILAARDAESLRLQQEFQPTGDAATGATEAGNAAAESAIKQGEAVRDLIANLQMEREALGLTQVEQQTVNALREAGAGATDAQRQQIIELIAATDAEKVALESSAEAMEAFGSVSEDVLGQFIDDMLEGKSAAESLGGILKSVGSQLIKFGLSGLFGSSGFGSLFQPRAAGGPVNAGQPYIVGEKRPEIFVPSQAGRIVPRVPSGGAGGGTSFTYAPTLSMPNADMAAVTKMQQVMARDRAEFEGKVRKIVQRRGKDW